MVTTKESEMRKIRRADGSVFTPPDDYVLQDGESLISELSFMDSMRRTALDEHIRDAQAKSDECVAAFNEAMAAIRKQNQAYFDACREALHAPPAEVTDRSPTPAPSILQPTDEDLAAGRERVEAAYREHNDWLQNAWRG
jgi:hypothetical protein